MLNLIVTICNDYKICQSWQHLEATSNGALQADALQQDATSDGAALHADATNDGATLQADTTGLYNQMQPVMCLSTIRCNHDGVALQPDAISPCTVSYYCLHEWC
jgi:hypothetical protein